MSIRVMVLFLFVSLSLSLWSFHLVKAAGVVGDGTPASCTEAAFTDALAQTGSGETLTFNCGASPHTITFTTPKLITQAITIDGGGLVTLSGGGTTTVLELNDYLPLLTLQNLTIADGYATPAGPYGVCRDNACGGGVRGRYRASLTVINSRFVNNRAVATPLVRQASLDYGGGAIYMHTGVLTVTNTQFTGNRATNSAGGAVHLLHSNAFISDSLFDGNHADYYGGAFFNDGTINDGKGITTPGLLQFRRVTFSGNTGRGQGGAVFNYMYLNRHPRVLADYEDIRFIDNSVLPDMDNHAYGGALRSGNGPLRVANAAFTGNTAGSQGGALWTGELGTVTVLNSTFTGNTATGLNANDGYGGAIRIGSAGRVSLTNLTIAHNHAGQLGGGIWGEIVNVSLVNNIIAHNTADNPWAMSQNCDRTYAGSSNLQSPRISTNDKPCSVSVHYGDPLLGTLADQAGAFGQMLPLVVNSPAIDAGTNVGCPEYDARGRFRTFDGDWDGKGQCDLGAYEYTGFDHPAAASAPPYRNVFTSPTPTLDWRALEWAGGYQIQVDNNADFASVNYTSEPAGVSATLGPLQGGVYYWRVRGKRPDGSWGSWSAPDSFLVRVP